MRLSLDSDSKTEDRRRERKKREDETLSFSIIVGKREDLNTGRC